MAHIASALPGAEIVTPALVLVLLAAVIRGFYAPVAHVIDELSREHSKPNL